MRSLTAIAPALFLTINTVLVANSYAQQSQYEGDPTYDDVRIKVQDDIDIPAEEEGVLITMNVREGTRVKQGDIIGTIDDRLPKAQRVIAEFSLEAARARADDDIEEKYAKKAAEVAKTDWEQDLEAERRSPGAVAAIQIRRKKLDWERSILQIEKAEKDQFLSEKEVNIKVAELGAADVSLERRTIKAPFDGDVQTVYRHQSEWVNPGEPILRLLKLDTMHVECFVDSSKFDPVDIAGKPVTVRVDLARGRKASFEGRIIYVSQSVQSDGHYLVRADVANERAGDYWLIRPGLLASMTIHVSETAAK
ncbi:HlyD family secretion protein [Adhaeretor mobilis]|uniref:Multidrug resistance protein MdtN n=1 Tax=Adhaeretor mobilis TaxID=1930276 RepID=A0A517N1M5_9BACT|nr:HlyD family efflux transporter periplasmic adaptor subunit [Adhaeretor mobilis]QDT01040.1 Multidrug resistance protein MdtN [Adhaeretor mobilis]